MDWIKELKIAIVEEDEEKIYNLMSNLPEFNSIEEANTVMALMQEAYKFILKKIDETKQVMRKLKTSKSFLESDRIKNIHKLLDKSL